MKEEKELLERIEETKEKFTNENNIDKVFDEVTEALNNSQNELYKFLITLKAEKRVIGIFKRLLRINYSNGIDDLINTTEVLYSKTDERLFLLEKLEIVLDARKGSKDTYKEEYLIKFLAIVYILVNLLKEENTINVEEYKSQINTIKKNQDYILHEEELSKKKNVENDINELRRILNND